jgi:hypothetical protein
MILYALSLVLLAIASAILGRMGGAKGFDTKYRDIGCSLIVVLACWMAFGWHPLAYLAVFILHWAAFSTYWDWLFPKTDGNLFFSGFMVGAALIPVLAINIDLWPIVASRMVLLCVVWGALNRYLPKKVFIWSRDVVEECVRYFFSL